MNINWRYVAALALLAVAFYAAGYVAREVITLYAPTFTVAD